MRAFGLGLGLAIVLVLPAPGFAHPGGLDAKGCHTDRKTGAYHCHRPQPQPVKPREEPPAARRATGVTGAYANCSAARAAGAAPVRRGEPGYGPHLDRDNDGIGCE